MLKNKDSKQRANFSQNSEVAYFLWLKSGCPESIEEIAYFSMLQSGRPRGADRAIWNETKRRLESHIRDNMGIPQPEVKIKKTSKNTTESVKEENNMNDKKGVGLKTKKIVKNGVTKKALKSNIALKGVKSVVNKSTAANKISKVSKADKNVISLKTAIKSKSDNSVMGDLVKKVKKSVSLKKKSDVKNVDTKVVVMPVSSALKKDSSKFAVNK